MKGLAKEHICTTIDADNSVVMARGKGGGGWQGGQGGGNGDICNSVNNKNK